MLDNDTLIGIRIYNNRYNLRPVNKKASAQWIGYYWLHINVFQLDKMPITETASFKSTR